jgi:hypothetical protein
VLYSGSQLVQGDVQTPQTFPLADDRLDPASAERACRVPNLAVSGRGSPHWIWKTGTSNYNALRPRDSDSTEVGHELYGRSVRIQDIPVYCGMAVVLLTGILRCLSNSIAET